MIEMGYVFDSAYIEPNSSLTSQALHPTPSKVAEAPLLLITLTTPKQGEQHSVKPDWSDGLSYKAQKLSYDIRLSHGVC
jgi:hypothetical protein